MCVGKREAHISALGGGGLAAVRFRRRRGFACEARASRLRQQTAFAGVASDAPTAGETPAPRLLMRHCVSLASTFAAQMARSVPVVSDQRATSG
ncbi:hypothetical protein Ga0100231_013470 [Opitutaceae bacterium TAV4]|nr:hypothetical protein Ga0100231_013470 [Opitutaceae bacterium TAV4]RRJ99419.1 hypothetical protein Ga0100230_014770 [Opitutaceae bacterium TAV3]